MKGNITIGWQDKVCDRKLTKRTSGNPLLPSTIFLTARTVLYVKQVPKSPLLDYTCVDNTLSTSLLVWKNPVSEFFLSVVVTNPENLRKKKNSFILDPPQKTHN